MRWSAGALTALLAAAVLAGVARAGTAPPPSVYDPSLERQRQAEQERDSEQRERAGRTEVPALRGGAPEDQKLPEDGRRFRLENIRFNSSSFLDADTLEGIAQDYVGRPVTFADLNELLRRVNALYERRDLLTARAIIPSQSVADGTLRVVLVEARLEAVEWQTSPETVPRSFFTERVPLETGEVLDTSRLLADIRRLNATTPGPQLSADLAAGESFGTTRLRYKVYEPEPFVWRVLANNYGSENSGTYQVGMSGAWFSPTGHADTLSGTVLKSRGTTYGNLRYRFPVNRYNGAVYASASRNALSIIRGPFEDLDIEGTSSVLELGFEQPWWLDRRWLATGRAGYEFSRSETTLEGDVPLSETRDGTATLAGSVEYRNAPWYARYEQRLLYTTHRNDTTGRSGQYQRLQGDFFTRWQAGEDYRLVGRFGWQYASASDGLPSSLLYQLGGPSSVRGYDAGILAAPHGLDLGLEAHWSFHPGWEASLLADYGQAVDIDGDNPSIYSLGVGLQYRLGRTLVARAVYAHAFKKVVPRQDSGQLLLQLSWRPW
ncbi:hypothetical protein KBTX_03989 [wastewater metagenome]|uniref:Heme/hemopexin transporter protein HuxB n=4 Tax=root TaxID=1 RepID=A0A5B8RFJ7_9ZZZZ|nr:hypothetical protein KBTEX_03989 [uncultured organism]